MLVIENPVRIVGRDNRARTYRRRIRVARRGEGEGKGKKRKIEENRYRANSRRKELTDKSAKIALVTKRKLDRTCPAFVQNNKERIDLEFFFFFFSFDTDK